MTIQLFQVRSVTFAPGETVKTFTVTVKEDLIPENDEAVQVVLSNPTNATLGDSSGIVVITDDDTTVWTATDIVTNADGAQDVHVADIDGDGDLDIVSAEYVVMTPLPGMKIMVQ